MQVNNYSNKNQISFRGNLFETCKEVGSAVGKTVTINRQDGEILSGFSSCLMPKAGQKASSRLDDLRREIGKAILFLSEGKKEKVVSDEMVGKTRYINTDNARIPGNWLDIVVD